MPAPLHPLSRQPLPSTLIAWALPEVVLALFREAVGRETRLCVVHNGTSAAKWLQSAPTVCLVVPVLRDRFDPFWTDYTALRERFPNIPVIAVATPGVSSMQAAMRLSQLGVSELLDTNEGVRAEDVRFAVSKAFTDATTQRVWQAVQQEFERQGDRCPDELMTLLKRALRAAHTHLPASRLAALVHMHERTLRKYCEAYALPSPQLLTGWARLLTAALFLDDPGRSITGVAELLGYPTPSALRKQIVRYTARSPRELREDGALRVVTDLFHLAIRPDRHGDAARPRLTLVRDEGAA